MRTIGLAVAASCALGVGITAQQGFLPAAFQNGGIPMLSVLSQEIGGGEVLAEITVSRDGAVIGARPLRTTPSFTERIVAVVNDWRFTPAEALVELSEQRPGGPLTRPIESRVLVAAVFRPPAFFAATSGETVSEVANASDDVPFPLSIVRPAHPANLRDAGVVLVEVRVNGSGAVIGAVIKASAPGFDDVALEAARQWRFRPARVGGAFVPSLVYIVFGFPMPAAIVAPGTPPGTISPTPGVIIPTPGH